MATPRPRPRSSNQLPSGRHGLGHEYVVENQRTRMLDAVVQVVALHGYGGLTIEHIVATSGVSRRTFYDHFANKEDVFLVAYDRIVDRLVDVVARAYDTGDTWTERLQRGLATFLEHLGREPAVAHVCVVDILGAGPTALARRTEAMMRFHPFFVPDPSHQPAGPAIPPLAADAAIGGAYEVVYGQVLAGNAARLPELLPDLLYGVLAPFVGRDAAAEHYQAARRGHPGPTGVLTTTSER